MPRPPASAYDVRTVTENVDDRRQHSRLQTQLEISVELANETRSAELRDLSRGGACLLLGGSELGRGETLQLRLPLGGNTVEVSASIVRSTPMQNGSLTAVRFKNTEPAQLEAVDSLLGELLASSGGGGRQHPRVSRRLRVPVGSEEEMLAVVENISLGGIAMKVEQELEVGEELLLVLPNAEGDDMLSLKARVANQRFLEGDDGPKTWLVGFTFDDLSAQTTALLSALLVSLLKDD